MNRSSSIATSVKLLGLFLVFLTTVCLKDNLIPGETLVNSSSLLGIAKEMKIPSAVASSLLTVAWVFFSCSSY